MTDEQLSPDDAETMADEEPAPDDDVVDELREMPVGTNDPAIVGDVGPTDVPPGADPP